MNQLTQTNAGTLPDLSQAEQRMACSRAFSAQRIETEDEATTTRAALADLTVPATRDWAMGRIATLLTHFYVTELPDAVTRALADDWWAELSGTPQWAIAEACRWWLSSDNKDRRKKPVPGDISAAAKRAMTRCNAAKTMLGIWDRRNVQ